MGRDRKGERLRRAWRLIAWPLALAGLAACSGQSAKSTGADSLSSANQSSSLKEEIVVRLWDNPMGFDPATLFRIETENVAFNIYSGLTTYDAQTGGIVPDLAESWESTDAQ